MYLSLQQSLIARGNEYQRRGNAYLANGQLKHAIGCYRKANRKWDRAESLSLTFEGMIDIIMFPMIEAFNKRIANTILYGTSHPEIYGRD